MTPVVTDRIKAFPSGSFLCRAQPERNAVRRGERRRHLLAEAGLRRLPETGRKGVGAESEGAPRSQGPGEGGCGGKWRWARLAGRAETGRHSRDTVRGNLCEFEARLVYTVCPCLKQKLK